MSEARSCFPGAALHWNDRSNLPLDWNGPTNRPFDPFPDESKARPIVELLERVVRRFPERIALCRPEVSITYAALSTSRKRPGMLLRVGDRRVQVPTKPRASFSHREAPADRRASSTRNETCSSE